MSSGRATITPFLRTSAEEVEITLAEGGRKKLWRKEVLPSGKRKYKDTELDFGQINPAVVKAFNENAYSPVYFVLSNPDNSHPKPGEETNALRGTVSKLELAEGRVYGYFDFSGSPEMETTIKRSNGQFGVSARIEVDYKRGDTETRYPYALSHVCGTTRPHIKGMSGWSSVELSDEEKSSVTVDLSTEVEDNVPNLTQEQLDKLLQFAEAYEKAQAEVDALEDATEEDEDVDTPEGTVSATLSEEARKAIELAEKQSRTALELAEQMQAQAAKTVWDTRKTMLVNEGVKPAVIALAEKVMSSHKPVVLELSDTDKVDAREVISKILDECKGQIPLGEEGSQAHGGQDQEFTDSVNAAIEAFDLSEWFTNSDDK